MDRPWQESLILASAYWRARPRQSRPGRQRPRRTPLTIRNKRHGDHSRPSGWRSAAALFLGRSEYEKDCLVTDTYEICSPKLTEGGRTLVF